MRALTCDTTCACFCSTLPSTLLSGAFRQRNGIARDRDRKRRRVWVSPRQPLSERPNEIRNSCPSAHAARSYGCGGAGNGGGGSLSGTLSGDADGPPPAGRCSILGIVITLACSSLPPQDVAEELASTQSLSRCCKSTEQAKPLSESSLSKATKLEDTSEIAQQLSVREAFAGRTVLLTGATGFVGSLVLEQLLRTCPDVHKIFVIARQKHGIPGPERVHQMLQNHPLFHLVRAEPPVTNCASSPDYVSPLWRERYSDASSANLESQVQPSCVVEVLAGDMTLPGYGIGEEEMLRLKQETEIVIHAAASISFDDHIHSAVTHNYMATKHLADMAADMPKLQAFVHVSTAYVNGNQPKGTRVPERMLPLRAKSEDDAALVSKLQALPEPQAAAQADRYMRQWHFPNTYCFSKHLAESLMAGYHSTLFPVAIVRPSIIGGLAGTPLPGYLGNTAGSTGAALAIATGIAAWTCHQPGSVFDLVPGDLVSSAILAAAAAVTQGCNRQKQPLIIHACTSSQNPLSTGQFFQHIQAYFTSHPPPFRAIFGPYPKYQGLNIVSNKQMLSARSAFAEAKFTALCAALKAAGKERMAKKLFAGWKAWQKYNCPALDFDLCFQTHNLQDLQRLISKDEKQLFRLSWEGQDWQRYMTTYMAGIRHGVFKQATLADAAKHDFIPWPVAMSSGASASRALEIKSSNA